MKTSCLYIYAKKGVVKNISYIIYIWKIYE